MPASKRRPARGRAFVSHLSTIEWLVTAQNPPMGTVWRAAGGAGTWRLVLEVTGEGVVRWCDWRCKKDWQRGHRCSLRTWRRWVAHSGAEVLTVPKKHRVRITAEQPRGKP